MDEDQLLEGVAPPDWEVICARCGIKFMASQAMVEEGDEWECGPCWDRCNAEEKAAYEARLASAKDCEHQQTGDR